MEWQAIETAPDATEVLVTGFLWNVPAKGRWLAVAYCVGGEWVEVNDGSTLYPPTHWMPVPQAPEVTGCGA